MSALKGSLKLSIAGRTITFKASEFHAPEDWGFWIAEKENEDVTVSIRCNGSASIDRYDDRSYFNLMVDYFPKELCDGTKVVLLKDTLNLPYNRDHEEDDD